ncbi:NAD(P)-dependent alcohol dehydrogenase [Streptomyces albus]|uniref:NAD(P)-dependent alcohol dehydrogenase n=1 Tax=Streptomyces albus TaxID=1888 RepID=UPI0033E3E5AC
MRTQVAAVETPGGPFVLREADIERPRPHEILVRLTAAGICHTDLSARQVWPEQRLPMVFGHEGTGIVEAIGDAVTTVAPGDTVCLSYQRCGTCEPCANGGPAYCTAFGSLNAAGTRTDGSTPLTTGGSAVYGSFFGQSSFATLAITHETNTVKIPSDVPPTVAAPLGCSVQTGVGTVSNVLRPAPGETLVVFGAGSVGLCAVMAAVANGCPVAAVDPIASRRALALDLGAEAVIDPTGDTDVPEAIRDLVKGGPHHAIDTTGRADVIAQAVAALRQRGSLALVGLGTVQLATMDVMSKGLVIRGVIEGDADPAEAVPYLVGLHQQGKLPVEKLISQYPFAEVEAAARAALAGEVIKPVLTFD